MRPLAVPSAPILSARSSRRRRRGLASQCSTSPASALENGSPPRSSGAGAALSARRLPASAPSACGARSISSASSARGAAAAKTRGSRPRADICKAARICAAKGCRPAFPATEKPSPCPSKPIAIDSSVPSICAATCSAGVPAPASRASARNSKGAAAASVPCPVNVPASRLTESASMRCVTPSLESAAFSSRARGDGASCISTAPISSASRRRVNGRRRLAGGARDAASSGHSSSTRATFKV